MYYCAAYKIDEIELITNEIQRPFIHYLEKYILKLLSFSAEAQCYR